MSGSTNYSLPIIMLFLLLFAACGASDLTLQTKPRERIFSPSPPAPSDPQPTPTPFPQTKFKVEFTYAGQNTPAPIAMRFYYTYPDTSRADWSYASFELSPYIYESYAYMKGTLYFSGNRCPVSVSATLSLHTDTSLGYKLDLITFAYDTSDSTFKKYEFSSPGGVGPAMNVCGTAYQAKLTRIEERQ